MKYEDIMAAMETKAEEILALSRRAYEFEPSTKPLTDMIRLLLNGVDNPGPPADRAHGSLYAKEFDASKITVPKFLFGDLWEDVSWHNDVCPRFENPTYMLAVWVDYDNPAERELNCMDGPYEENVWKKFNVIQMVHDGTDITLSNDTLFSTEDADELQAWLVNYATNQDTPAVACPDCKDVKVFLCVWGPGYMEGNEAKLEHHTQDWFTKDRGYDSDDLKVLDLLNIGGCIQIPDIGVHSVVRIR